MSARSLAFAAALGLVATPTFSQDAASPDRPSLWDVLSVETLGTSLAHALMGSARAFADIRYDRISVDPMAARVDFTGLRISPLVPGTSGPCHINAAQATLRGASLDRIESGRVSIVLDDLTVGNGCLPEEVATLARGLGHDTLSARRLEADLSYDYASGGGDLRISADFDRLLSVQVQADLDYISYRMDLDSEEPVVAVDLNAAQISITDLGAWAIARNFLPPQMKTPEGLSAVTADGTRDILREANGYIHPLLSDRQETFAREIGAFAARFADGAPPVVIATNIADAPVRLDEAGLRDFRTIFDALAPSIGASSPAVATVIPAAKLETALEAQEPTADALAMGRALITGIGAPRNVDEGVRLLLPLARGGDTQASGLVAVALEARNPAAAYEHALRASAAGEAGSLALLDRLERDLPFQTILGAQHTALGDDTPDSALYSDPRAMRDAMRGYFMGIDRPRSYAAAYYWALMDAASGDAAGTVLRDDIAEMMRLRGDAAQWAEVAARLENSALRDWIASDVPAALQSVR